MTDKQKYALTALRVALGILFLYAGLSKLVDPSWSAAGYLKGAKTFHGLYVFFASSSNIGWVNFLNEWGLTLIGLSLITGFWVRYAAWAGIALMLLYYFPVLEFPFVGEHSFLVDEHIIYIGVLLLFALGEPGKPDGWGFLDSHQETRHKK